MSRYPQLAIEEFCETGSGGTPERSKRQYYGGSIPWVKSGELREDVILDTEERITELGLKESSAKIVPRGSILLAMYGATVGRMAFLGIDAATNQAICNIRPDPKRADPRYVFHGLQSKLSHFLARAAGGAQPNISQTIVRETKLALPPLEEQRQIASILDKADALRRKRRRTIELLESLTQSIFLEMFGHPVVNQRGISVQPLSNVATFMSGGTPSKNVEEFWAGSIPWVSPKDMKVNDILDAVDHVSEAAIARKSLKLIEPMAVLMVVRGMILAHTVPIAITHRAVTINQDMKAIRFDNKVDPVFGLWCLKTQSDFILSRVGTAAHGTKRLEMADVEQLNILIPSEAKQQKFVVVAQTVGRLISASRMALRADNSFFSSLQHRAFSGAH